nr:Rieske 2Fe-2S domain-containing protein [Listeria monocytogenes]
MKENSPQEFEVDGIDVVLVRTDGEVFAVGATCTHAEVPMVYGCPSYTSDAADELDGVTLCKRSVVGITSQMCNPCSQPLSYVQP